MPSLVAWVITWGTDKGGGILCCCPECVRCLLVGLGQVFAYLLLSGLQSGDSKTTEH